MRPRVKLALAVDQAAPLLITFVGIVALIFLVARLKLHSFLALVIVSLFVGLASGMKPAEVGRAFQEGMGATLGFVAPVVGLGTILGQLLSESGGAAVIARTLSAAFGTRHIHWTMMLVGLLVGLPVFFAVGLVLLTPIVLNLARETNKPLLLLGLPLVAGLSVAHGLVPPHPGPIVAVEKLGADLGMTLFYSFIVGLPSAVIAGPLFTLWVLPRLKRTDPEALLTPAVTPPTTARTSSPSFATALSTILLPLLLMMLATAANLALPTDHPVRVWGNFLGHPIVSMGAAVLLALYTLGAARGFNRQQLLAMTEASLAPAAAIVLIVGAGGGFSKVLDYASVDEAMANLMSRAAISPLLFGWVVAALIRIAVGSATVSITMSAAIVGPVAALIPGTNRELLVLALGAGSVILSHVNDGGFWFVKEYLQMSVGETFRTWTVIVTLISISGLLMVLLLNAVIQ